MPGVESRAGEVYTSEGRSRGRGGPGFIGVPKLSSNQRLLDGSPRGNTKPIRWGSFTTQRVPTDLWNVRLHVSFVGHCILNMFNGFGVSAPLLRRVYVEPKRRRFRTVLPFQRKTKCARNSYSWANHCLYTTPATIQILVSQFQMRREDQGGVFLEWTNAVPIDPNDVQLSRVDCDQVMIVVSGCLKATCRRCGKGST